MKKKNKKNKLFSFLKTYNFETLVLFLFLLGIFLSTQDFDLSDFLRVTIVSTFKGTTSFLVKSFSNIASIFQGIRLSNSLGAIILFSSIVLIFRRIRFRMINNSDIKQKACKVCNGELGRKKSKVYLKRIGLLMFLKLKTYDCKNCKKEYVIFKSK